jgi:hypothetical protein
MSPLLLSHSHQRPPSYQTRFQIHRDCRATPLIRPDFRCPEIVGPPLLSGQISDSSRLKGHPSYQARFQMPWDSKILLSYPPQGRPPILQCHFFITEWVMLLEGNYCKLDLN